MCDRSSGSAIFLLSGWQDGARKGGRSLLPVESRKLGSGSFLQVAACKTGGRSLLPVEAEKLKSLYKGVLPPSSYFWKTILKRLPWFSPHDLGFHVKILCIVLLCFLCDDDNNAADDIMIM